jgi:hypothetical protein
LTSDWRVTPSRVASRSSSAIIHAGKVDVYAPVFLAGPPCPCGVQCGGHVLAALERLVQAAVNTPRTAEPETP